MDPMLTAVTIGTILGTALVGGAFFAQGLATMESIDLVAMNPRFLAVSIGTAWLSAVLIGLNVARLAEPGALYLLSGGALYLFGMFGVTALACDPLRRAGSRAWTRWNHVRVLTAALGLVVLAMGLADVAGPDVMPFAIQAEVPGL